MTEKMKAAERAVSFIRDGMTVGLGSGSTAGYAIEIIGDKVRQGLDITAVASSVKSERLAKDFMIPVIDPSAADVIDIAIDGADEVDPEGNLSKGGGGSLLREKVIAYASRRFYVIIDESKLVSRLGAKMPLSVEIIPFGYELTLRHLRSQSCDPLLRQRDGRPFVTDNGNFIADCVLGEIADPALLDRRIRSIPGVVETGFFPAAMVSAIFVGSSEGEVREIRVRP